MKKCLLTSIICTATIMLSGCSSSKSATNGNTDKSMQKDNYETIERLAKEYKAEGFVSESMAYSMEEKIAAFRNKLVNNENLVEIVSEGKGASSFAAEMQAQNAAAIQYATAAGSVVKGGMERDFGNTNENWDAFHGSYVQNVADFIMPLLKKEMKFTKREDNLYVVKIGYILDEKSALEARTKAYDEAMKKIAGGMAFGEGVRKYIEEVIRPNGNE